MIALAADHAGYPLKEEIKNIFWREALMSKTSELTAISPLTMLFSRR